MRHFKRLWRILKSEPVFLLDFSQVEKYRPNMEQSAILFSIFYWLCAFLFVVGPAEFKSGGITIENFFSGYLGSEDLDIINFHIKRTALTVFIHSLLPLSKLCFPTFQLD